MAVEALAPNPPNLRIRLSYEAIDEALSVINCKDAETRDFVRRSLHFWSRKDFLVELISHTPWLKKEEREKLAKLGRLATDYSNAIIGLGCRERAALTGLLMNALWNAGARASKEFEEAERQLLESLTITKSIAGAVAGVSNLRKESKGRPPDELSLWVIEELAATYNYATGKMPGRSTSAVTGQPIGRFYRFIEPIWRDLFGDTSGLGNTVRRWVEWRKKDLEDEFPPC